MLLVVVHAMARTGVIWLIMEGLLWSVNSQPQQQQRC